MKLAFTLSLAFFLACTSLFAQTIIYVAPVNSGSANGTSWANASADLVGRMLNATPNTEIWVKQGTYRPISCTNCNNNQRSTSFVLKPGVRVIGGFKGDETAAAQADAANVTTLSGDIGTANVKTDNSYNVVHAPQVGDAAGLRNLTITGGYAFQTSAANVASRGKAGAGIYIDGDGIGGLSSPTIVNCSIVNNDATGFGAGVFVSGAALRTGEAGGEASPVFRNCLISGNTTRGSGGGIHVNAAGGTASPTFADTRITNNATVSTATTDAGSGAGVSLAGTAGVSRMTFDRCLISGNSADPSTSGNPIGNTGATGGGMYIQIQGGRNPNVVVSLRNSVVSKNTCYSGGGIYNNRGVLNLTNVTVTDNEARGEGSSGGGLYINGGVADIVNSIIYFNKLGGNPFGGRDIRFVEPARVNISYSLVQAASRSDLFSCSNGTCNNDTLNTGAGMKYGRDPMFASSGAAVPVPQASSPAIDAGLSSEAYVEGGDYIGAQRIQNAAVDLGAIENGGAPLPVELLSFAAEPQFSGIQLEWSTASEVDLEGYRILRSTDGIDFVEIGDAPATGSGDYFYTDRAVVPGRTYYYQLRSVDLDGTSYDSEVVAATLGGSGSSSTLLSSEIYPNPTSAEVRLTLQQSPGARTVYASVIDFTGRTLKVWPLTTDGTHSLDLSDLPEGSYVLRLRDGEREESSAIVVQR